MVGYKGSTLRSEAAALDRRLSRSAMRAGTDTRDTELSQLLLGVSARRSARTSTVPLSRLQPTPRAERPDPMGTKGGGAEPAGTLIDNRRVADTIHILRVKPPERFVFRAGQHIKLGIPGGPRNPYTIASAPGEGVLEFCIERAPGGRVSPRLFALTPGQHLALGDTAKGSFALVSNAEVHLMVATGTGIAPFRSMLRDCQRRAAWPGHFLVLHGASFQDELPYRDELEALAQSSLGRVRYLPSISRPSDARNRGWPGQTGRVAALVPAIASRLVGTAKLQVYACGNPGMIAHVRNALEGMGVAVASEAFD